MRTAKTDQTGRMPFCWFVMINLVIIMKVKGSFMRFYFINPLHIGKWVRLRSDATLDGIWLGSTLFAIKYRSDQHYIKHARHPIQGSLVPFTVFWMRLFIKWGSLSCLVTKPTKWVCAQRRLRSACASASSLIRVFAVRMKKAWILSYPLSKRRRLWSDWADAQADLSLRWAHSHFVGFVMRWLIC